MSGHRMVLVPASLLWQAREAFRFTREYVGEEMLPPIEGWSWFDADTALAAALAADPDETREQVARTGWNAYRMTFETEVWPEWEAAGRGGERNAWRAVADAILNGDGDE